MIFFQLLLLRECVQVKSKQAKHSDFARESFIKNFWRWNDFNLYIQAIVFVWGVLMFLTYALIKNPVYTEAIGTISLLIEACLGLPQLISNHRNKNANGLSIGLILNWFFGDSSKIYYYLKLNQPMQFVMCGTLQLVVDILILAQIYIYRPRKDVSKIV